MLRAATFVLVAVLATAAVAGPLDTPRCDSVPACVALAEKDPATFSPSLRDDLDKLSGEALVAGLGYRNDRPQVTSLVKAAIHGALCSADGHTAASAQALWGLAEAVERDNLRACWLKALSVDAEGRKVLAGAIAAAPDGDRRFEVMLAYLSGSGRASKSEIERRIQRRDFSLLHDDLGVPVPADEAPLLTRCREAVWSRFVARRGAVDVSALDRGVNEYIQVHAAYDERLGALLAADVKAGKVPSEADLWLFSTRAQRAPGPFALMLDWAESDVVPLRRTTVCHLLLAIGEGRDAPTRDRVRRILIAAALDPDQPERDQLTYFLLPLVAGASEAQAAQLAEIAHLRLSKDRYDDSLLFLVALRFERWRAPFVKRLLGDDLDDAARVIELGSHDRPAWLTEPARAWIAGLTEAQLKDEAAQERFIVLAGALRDDRWSSVPLPPTRRPHAERGIYRCYGGPAMAYRAAVEERRDLEAFGKPLPEKTPEEQVPEAGRPGHFETNEVPAAPPLTPQEATVRWQKFVLARDALLAKKPEK